MGPLCFDHFPLVILTLNKLNSEKTHVNIFCFSGIGSNSWKESYQPFPDTVSTPGHFWMTGAFTQRFSLTFCAGLALGLFGVLTGTPCISLCMKRWEHTCRTWRPWRQSDGCHCYQLEPALWPSVPMHHGWIGMVTLHNTSLSKIGWRDVLKFLEVGSHVTSSGWRPFGGPSAEHHRTYHGRSRSSLLLSPATRNGIEAEQKTGKGGEATMMSCDFLLSAHSATRAEIFSVWGLDCFNIYWLFEFLWISLNFFEFLWFLFCVFVVRNQGRGGSAWKMLVPWSWRSFVRPDMRCSGLVAYDVADTRGDLISTDLQTQQLT